MVLREGRGAPVKKVTKCRACGSAALTPVFSMPTAASLLRFASFDKDAGGYVLCDPSRDARACGLMQSATVLASEPSAPSSRRSSTRDHLRAAATEALEIISGRDCAALDIGCSDGALLSYYPRWVERFGVDPSAHIDDVGDWARTAREAFPSPAADAALGEQRFDIITAISVLEFVHDPRKLLAAVKQRLTEDGVFVLETLYSPLVLTRNAVEALQAGVSAVYSLSVLEWLIRDAGLKVFKGALTSKEGGSIRLFVTHEGNDDFDFDPWYERLATLWDEENALAMRAAQPYQSFERRLEDVRAELIELLNAANKNGETVHILGADRQTEALLQWARPASKTVSAAVDTPASRERMGLGEKGPRIISEADCRAAEPDILIAPARYKREMLERWRETVMLGARMVFVSPRPHAVNAANYAAEYGRALSGGEGPAGVESLRAILAAAGGPRLIAENTQHAESA